jgi:hypothetical protein
MSDSTLLPTSLAVRLCLTTHAMLINVEIFLGYAVFYRPVPHIAI